MLVESSETASILMRTTWAAAIPRTCDQDTGLGPAVHARVDRVPVAEPFGQSAPLAAMLGHIEDGVDYLQVAQADIAALLGQTVLDGGELLGCDLHAEIVRAVAEIAISVNALTPGSFDAPSSFPPRPAATCHHHRHHAIGHPLAPAAQAAGWTLLAMTLTVFVVFRLG